MANFKDPKDNNQDSASFLGTAAAFSPLGYAAYHVGQRIRNEGSTINPKQDSMLSAIKEAANSMRTPSIPNMQDHLNWIKAYSNAHALRTPNGGEIARLAWMQAASYAGPRAQGPLGPITDTIKGVQSNQVVDAIDMLMKDKSSAVLGPTMRRFRRNVEAVQRHYEITGAIPHVLPSIYKAPAAIDTNINRVDPFIQKYVKRWEEQGLSLNKIQTYRRPEFEHHSHMLYFTGPHGEEINMMVPTVHKGTFLEGQSLRTKYISRMVDLYDPVSKTSRRMQRPEYMMEVFERNLLPALKRGNMTDAEINRAMSTIRQHTMHELETVPNIPKGIDPLGWNGYIDERSKYTQVVVARDMPKRSHHTAMWSWEDPFRPLKDSEVSGAMSAGKLHGGTSATNIAESVYSTRDISRVYGTPKAMDWARRLEQFNRPWQLTPRADKLARERFGVMDSFANQEMRKLKGNRIPPYARMLLVDPAIHGEKLSKLGIGEGAFAIHKRMAPALEQEWSSSIHIAFADKGAIEMIKDGKGDKLVAGQIIGWDTDSGMPVTAGDINKQVVLDATVHNSTGKGDYATLTVKNTHQMQEWEKFYGIKGMGQFQSGRDIGRSFKELGIQGGFDAIAASDDIRKNQGLHNQQMVSALWDFLDRSATFRKASNSKKFGIDTFLDHPNVYMEALGKYASRGDSYNHGRAVAQVMKTAISANINPEEFGLTFGMAPGILKELGIDANKMAAGMLKRAGKDSTKYIAEMNRGFAVTGQQLWWGGKQQVGGLGSIEPRAFEIFEAGAMGPIGKDIGQDIMGRMVASDPNKLLTHNALWRSIETLAGNKEPIDKELATYSAKGYDKGSFQSFIEKGGGYLKLGKGLEDVYVPGSDVFRGMDPYKSIGGETIRGEVPNIYHTLANKGKQMYEEGGLSTTEMRSVMEQGVQELMHHAAPGGKGMGGYLRNEVLGSRYLSAVTKHRNMMPPDAQTAILPMSHLKKMLYEMKDYGVYTEKEVVQHLETLSKGGKIGGMIARHPLIGEYSFQFMNFMAGPSKQDVIGLPSIYADVKIGGNKIKGMLFGPGYGLAQDFDGDPIAAFLVKPQHETYIRKTLENEGNEYTNRYVQHQLRLGLLKAKKGQGVTSALSLAEKQLAETQKLGIAQRWTPTLSVDISRARAAVSSYVSGEKLADAKALFEVLEQQAISGKHVSPEQVLGNRFTSMLAGISSSLQEGDAKQLEEHTKSLFGGNPDALRLLEGNLPLENAAELSKKVGFTLPEEIAGLNLTPTTNTIASAMRQWKDSDAARTYELLMNRGSAMKLNEVSRLSSVLMHAAGGDGAFAGVAKAALTAKNLLAKAGRSIIENYKPLAWGLAGSLAIATALSTPSETIGSGSNLHTDQPKMNPKGADRMSPEQVHPDSPPIGQPTVPRMLVRNSTSLGPIGSRVRVSANARGPIDPRTLGGNMHVSGVRSINLNVHDNRSSSNPHILANRYFGR